MPPLPGPASASVAAERRSPTALAALLVVMGSLHFVAPGPFERLVPRWLGSARFWVLLSGTAEVLFGAALLPARTRRVAAWGAVATLVAVFPGNVQMAIAAGAPVTPLSAATWLRLPLQVPLVAWALRYARNETDYRLAMAVDEELLAELKRTKAEIDRLQVELKNLVGRLQEGGATTEEIKQALRG